MSATSRAFQSAVTVLFAVAFAPTARAQIQASEAYTLTQVMDSVAITIDGYRPSARGRTIYGGVVPLAEDLYTWGESYEGELVQVMGSMIWEMTRQNGRVASLEIRDTPGDELWLTGTRLP